MKKSSSKSITPNGFESVRIETGGPIWRTQASACSKNWIFEVQGRDRR